MDVHGVCNFLVDAGDLVVMNGDLWIPDGSAWEFRQQTW